MRLSADVVAVNNVSLARRMHDLGMMPKLINDFIPGTKKLVRSFDDLNPRLYFSRGYSKTWAKSNDGFKMSNILFKIYGIVSGDPSLSKGVDIVYTATAWEVATIQYPDLINKKICDISRFTYLLKKVVSNEFLVSVCKTHNCCNRFIVHEDSDRYFCWACAENYSSISLNKMGESLSIESQLNKETLYAPKNKCVKECFDSSVYLSASRHMFLSSQIKAKA
ncbi:MAG: hypothetical protein V7749_00080 [Cocleimonas sp.]